MKTITALACAVMLASAPKPATVTSLTLSARALSASQASIKGCWTLNGPADGIRDSLRLAGRAPQAHALVGAPVCDSFTIATAHDSTVSGAFVVAATKRGLVGATYTAPFTYTAPPIVDSVRVRPVTVTLETGKKSYVCQLGYLSNKAVVLGAVQDTVPACLQARDAARLGL
jgi:hypothetical protein